MAPLDGKDACVVSIEVDGRQRYVFESDKLMEMLGASRIIAETVEQAEACFVEPHLHLFNPVSGEIRAWAGKDHRDALLKATWKLRTWLHKRGVEHTCAYMETDRRHFEQDGAAQPEEEIDPDRLPTRPSLGWVHHAIGVRVSARKGSKTAVDARPVCSLFAPCRIHPLDAANEWRGLRRLEDAREARRNQRGFRARVKEDTWTEGRRQFYSETLTDPVWRRALGEGLPTKAPRRPIDFTDLADQLDDPHNQEQFIAFLCGDGDEMGRVLTGINWNDPRWYGDTPQDRRPKPWQRSQAFAWKLDACVQEALSEAIADVTVTPAVVARLKEALAAGQNPKVELPCLPQLTGGDDIWAVAKRDIALDLATAFSTRFEAQIRDKTQSEYEVVHQALELVPGAAMSISLGVAFAKAGHPAQAMIEAAESLLGSAKSLRKGQAFGRGGPRTTGCLDWHWIESSLSEGVKEARARGWSYSDPDDKAVLFLTTRPWEARQCDRVIEAARLFKAKDGGVARRKREQLEGILRRGRSLSLLAWTAWCKGLDKDEREVLRNVANCLAQAGLALETGGGDWQGQFAFGPWLEATKTRGDLTFYWTPWLDLLALADVLAAPEHGEGAEDVAEQEATT